MSGREMQEDRGSGAWFLYLYYHVYMLDILGIVAVLNPISGTAWAEDHIWP